MPRTKESKPFATSVGGLFKRCWEVIGFPFNFVAKATMETLEQGANYINIIHAWFINMGGSVGRILKMDEGFKAIYENIKKGSDFFGGMLFNVPKHLIKTTHDVVGDIASHNSAAISPTQQTSEALRHAPLAKNAAVLDDYVKKPPADITPISYSALIPNNRSKGTDSHLGL